MEFDTKRADEKHHELIELAQQALSDVAGHSAEDTAEALIDNFTNITPPERPPVLRHMVTMDRGGRGGGTSVKPGNFQLNLRRLTDAIASGVLVMSGATSAPWLLMLAAIVLWNRVWSELTIELSEDDAAVLWTLWKNRDEKNCVSLPNLLEVVNQERRLYSRDPMTPLQLEAALSTLQKIRCVEKSAAEPSAWWLREWVRVKYR